MPERHYEKKMFVTVGTTQFDELVNQILHPDTLEIIEGLGYNHLTIQVGQGPDPQIPDEQRIHIAWYRLKESIAYDIEHASLVISHAGAGSCLEVLDANKPLIVVVNKNLMGNHQLELAQKLHAERHVLMCYPETLNSTLAGGDISCLRILPKNNQPALSFYIEKLMGF